MAVLAPLASTAILVLASITKLPLDTPLAKNASDTELPNADCVPKVRLVDWRLAAGSNTGLAKSCTRAPVFFN